MQYLLATVLLIISHLALVYFGFHRLDVALRELITELKKPSE